MVGARRIRSEEMKGHQYREGYTRSLEEKRVELDRDDNVKNMWEQVKQAMVESGREVCGSVRVGGKNSKCVVEQQGKSAVRRKETAWKVVLAASNKEGNMACERSVVPENWRSYVDVPQYKGKEARTEHMNYKGIGLLIKQGWKTICGIFRARR